jgi:ATP-binding cassette subfamily B protein
MTNYSLNSQKQQTSLQLSKFLDFIRGDFPKFILAIFFALITSAIDILTPYSIAIALDNYIANKNLNGLLNLILLLAVAYLARGVTSFLQTRIMGHVSQDTLYKLRDSVFKKLQELPISFFNQNKSGDLTSRINNDTDKMNTFLSESIIRFLASFFSIIGIGVFVIYLNPKLGLITVSVSLVLYFISAILAPIVKQKNKQKLNAEGNYSAQVQESLNNFRVIVAFNRKDYFKEKLAEINEKSYKAGLWSSILNEVFKPIYDFAANFAQVIVLIFGIYFISKGELTIGFLIAYISYTQKFYDPLRILGVIWGNIQSALAAWSRLQDILNLKSDLQVIKNK